MSDSKNQSDAGAVSEAALKRAETFVAAEEGRPNRLRGAGGAIVTAIALAMSVVHLYAAYGIISAQVLRPVHVGFVFVLVFLLFPVAERWRDRIEWWDLGLGAIGVGTVAYMIAGGDDLMDRNTSPNDTDIVVGAIFIALVLEAARRTTGWIMPAVAIAFVVYAMTGPYLPLPWTHRGYDAARLVGHLYMTLEGIFGVAVDVSSSLIILFTIFGAFLHHSGAGKFFIDFAFAAMGGKARSAGRTVTLASFLLGGPSGSGVATTVTLATVAYPMLARAGYGKEAAGGLLAAGGLGAIISPPVLGAAAFLIAEFLKISYLDVIRMAVIPTLLYYFALFLVVEIDARKFGIDQSAIAERQNLGELTRRFGFHFLSIVSVVGFMVVGYTPALAVFWATVVAFGASFLNRESALMPRKFVTALAAGSTSVLHAAATCAAAGIIVGVTTLTGLGLKFSAIAIAYAGGSLVLTAVYTALIVWVVGLAVPVTASYIICAVITAPALIQLGVPAFAAHMFIFYYAVLSEVSPPTALSPFAAAAITGGGPYLTTLHAWKYALPAFLAPFVFVLDPHGVALLLAWPKGATAFDCGLVIGAAFLGIVAFAAGIEGWLVRRATAVERTLFVVAGFLLMFPGPFERGLGLVAAWPGGMLRPLGLALLIAATLMQRRDGAAPRP